MNRLRTTLTCTFWGRKPRHVMVWVPMELPQPCWKCAEKTKYALIKGIAKSRGVNEG